MKSQPGYILVVDDSPTIRMKLSFDLETQGHSVTTARNGREALTLMQEQAFDLVLLDILMPEMNGYDVLRHMNQDAQLRNIPVIVISAFDEIESLIRCIQMGAEDYLLKTLDPVLLKARIDASLEKKRWHDQEQAYLQQLQEEREKSEALLFNVLPKPVAERLKQGETVIADSFSEVTVLFADIVGFTELSTGMTPTDLVVMLNDVFCTFDYLAARHGLEKIKTTGDAYMVVGGLFNSRSDHIEAVADMALDIRDAMALFSRKDQRPLNVRIGFHMGPVVAGVLGTNKYSYDLWGDTVNTASRMESHGIVGKIQVTDVIYSRLRGTYVFEERGHIPIKNKGEMKTYFLVGKREQAAKSSVSFDYGVSVALPTQGTR